LGRVGAHLEAHNVVFARDFAVTHGDVADDGGFAAAGEDAVAGAKFAIFDEDVFDGWGGFILEGERAFCTL
jgi:hypothetical protein